jgi:long-chain fatty acid transport protein
MRKFIVMAAAALCAVSAQAEGYQVNTLSAKQIGMGHTGTALKLRSESMIFNPAGMAWMDGTVDFSGSFTGIFATSTATVGGKEYETSNDPSTPVSANLAFRVYDNLKVGVSFYTPYGSNINWTENWPGAVLNQSVKLATYTIQPTVAWRILPNLSVGAGMMITWGSVNLNKGLVTPSTMDAVLAAYGYDYRYGDTTPASVNLKGKAQTRVGLNVGAMWDITNQWTVGFSYRSRMDMKVKAGTATVNYASGPAEMIMESKNVGLINSANFTATMPCAAIYSIGVSYKPVSKLTLALDAQLTGWNAYKELDIEFLSEQASAFNQYIEKEYKNSWLFRVGGEYKLTDRFDVRAGLVLDTTPVDDTHYNPETPGMTKIEPSVGVSFRPIKQMSIDASLLYVAGLGADNRTCAYRDMVTGQDRTFTADYRLHAVVPSIGISFNF